MSEDRGFTKCAWRLIPFVILLNVVEITGNSASPALWLSLCAGISLVGVVALRHLTPKFLTGELLTEP